MGLTIKLPQYDHIILSDQEIEKIYSVLIGRTEEEVNEAFRLARRAKDAMIKESEYLKRISEERKFDHLTFDELYNNILHSGYIPSKYNEPILSELCYYFTADHRFNGDLEKGILLAGGVGCGKTFTMSKFKDNQHASFIIKSCREVTYEFGQYGFSVLIRYGKNIQFPENRFGHTDCGVMFDDLGTDEDVRFYGNDKNPMQEILQQRYDNCLPKYTHITTNLTGDQIEQIYGVRIRSRIREMFNTLVFDTKAKDMRR